MSRWFRFYDDALNDPKVQCLAPETFRAWVNLLCLASKSDGQIPSLNEASFALRTTPTKAGGVIADLWRYGLLDKVEGGYFAPHNWSKRQFKSDTSNERVKRHRERHSNDDCNVTDTADGNSSETPPETEQSRTEQKASCAVAKATRTAAENQFEEFKKAYPKRDGANPWKPAYDVFKRAIGRGIDAEMLVGSASSYAAECARKQISGTEKVAQALTWLRQERWKDYAPTPVAALDPGKVAAAEAAAKRLGYEIAPDGNFRKAANDARPPTEFKEVPIQ